MKIEYSHLINAPERDKYRVYILIGYNEIPIGKSFTLIGARENAIASLKKIIKHLEADNKKDRKERENYEARNI